MNEYGFKGYITSKSHKRIPFDLLNGNIRFSLCFESDVDLSQRNYLISGITDDNKEIHLLIDYLWKADFSHAIYDGKEVISVPHIEGVVSACAVVEPGTFDRINSIGFYSPEISKITNQQITGCLNDNNSSWMNIKKVIAKYTQNGNNYSLNIGFVENKPFYNGQLLELKADKKFDVDMMKESYWVMKKFFSFLYQKRTTPLQTVLLRANEKNVGQLFVEKVEEYKYSFHSVKCIPIIGWDTKLDSLLQKLANGQIYLRHLPVFKDDEKVVTPGRFLMALIGFENALDTLDIHSISLGRRNEHLKDRIKIAIEDNLNEISNFFVFESLGNDIDEVSTEIAKVRNKLAHGYLDFDLTIKNSYQMHFLMLFILYLQLIYIGFDKNEACQIVPQIWFEH